MRRPEGCKRWGTAYRTSMLNRDTKQLLIGFALLLLFAVAYVCWRQLVEARVVLSVFTRACEIGGADCLANYRLRATATRQPIDAQTHCCQNSGNARAKERGWGSNVAYVLLTLLLVLLVLRECW